MLQPLLPACAMALALAAGVLAGCATPPGPGIRAVAGGHLVDARGMALYTRDRDVRGSGKSGCDYPCDKLWPPAYAPAGAVADGDYSLVERTDGTRQWAWRGWPLYRYAEDEAAGEAKGDGYRKAWHLAKPQAAGS
jgi:predicted lipoprotein with Yx(FWY)xxD motif